MANRTMNHSCRRSCWMALVKTKPRDSSTTMTANLTTTAAAAAAATTATTRRVLIGGLSTCPIRRSYHQNDGSMSIGSIVPSSQMNSNYYTTTIRSHSMSMLQRLDDDSLSSSSSVPSFHPTCPTNTVKTQKPMKSTYSSPFSSSSSSYSTTTASTTICQPILSSKSQLYHQRQQRMMMLSSHSKSCTYTTSSSTSTTTTTTTPLILDVNIIQQIRMELKQVDVNDDGQIGFEELQLLLSSETYTGRREGGSSSTSSQQKNHHHPIFTWKDIERIGELFFVGYSGKTVSHTTFVRSLQYIAMNYHSNQKKNQKKNQQQEQNDEDKLLYDGTTNNTHHHHHHHHPIDVQQTLQLKRKNPIQLDTLIDTRCWITKPNSTSTIINSIDSFYDTQMEFESYMFKYIQELIRIHNHNKNTNTNNYNYNDNYLDNNKSDIIQQ